ncbi:predicted protein [Uncinocarpus reesii 1704]|uniref:Uncharacterized protein n=1 Tax=Uncinocarpus reesii (strain UAMH 1704) TaxID=336963 RepID=C4JTS0_UNCRE|nr:uncharacterized protein UREG_05859 [Uncinocarpus reesii 1704]EEP81017.1 predicted protein [Uncinocarpus reesii 1704]
MKRIALRAPKKAHGSVCQFCQFSSASRQLALQLQAPLFARKLSKIPKAAHKPKAYLANFSLCNSSIYRYASSTAVAQSKDDPDLMLRDVLRDSHAIITGTALPSEETVVELLERCKNIVKIALLDNEGSTEVADNNATSSLLDLEDENGNANKSPAKPKRTLNKNFRQRTTIAISSMLDELVRDPKVFISPNILHGYTVIQSQLKKADHFPEVFSLYASKPAPQASGSTITYHPVNPKSPKNAIPQELADMALDIAIEQQNLPLALAIVDKTFCTPAFRRAKVLRKASLPLMGLVGAPPAAYIAATYASTFQNTMNPTTSTWIAFSAILAYITFTSSVGLVAIATANDQMRRVVWLPGMPLRERWLREEERAAMDKIAVAWGFKDPWMQGEEEGEEWESLREILGMRGMILDKTDLMEGME